MKKLKKSHAGLLGGIALAFALQTPAFADEVLDKARALVNNKQAKAALDMLLPLEATRAGNVDYDYLVGLAALDVGDPQLAIFALERVLAVNPQHSQARAEMARALFEVGERDSAKREFQNVLATNPPEQVRQTIEKFLSVLSVGERRLSGFFEFGIGTDSNVNSATGSSQIAVPSLGGLVTLGAGGTRLGDNFSNIAAGVNLVQPLTEEWSLLAGAAANIKFNGTQTQFDTNSLDGNVGARWARGKEVLSAGVQMQKFSVDNSHFRDTAGIVAQWQHNYSETRQITAFTQISDLRYPTQTLRNARREIYGVAFAEGLTSLRNAVVYGSFYLGKETETAEGVQYLGHKPVGMRLGGQMDIRENVALFVAASHEQRHYGGTEPLFLTARTDNQSDLRVGVNYRFSPGWTLTPQLTYTDNKSNIATSKYTRTAASLVLRLDF